MLLWRPRMTTLGMAALDTLSLAPVEVCFYDGRLARPGFLRMSQRGLSSSSSVSGAGEAKTHRERDRRVRDKEEASGGWRRSSLQQQQLVTYQGTWSTDVLVCWMRAVYFANVFVHWGKCIVCSTSTLSLLFSCLAVWSVFNIPVVRPYLISRDDSLDDCGARFIVEKNI